MSFEGYYQKLCPNGHYQCTDVYMDASHCPICLKKYVYSHMVDTTNDEGRPMKFRVKKTTRCTHCKSVVDIVYHIPKNKILKG